MKQELVLSPPMANTNPGCERDDAIINTLPDSILCHILSFLPTITSVRTCILSRRWRHLWKDLQIFNLSFILGPNQLGVEILEYLHWRFLVLANAVRVQRNPLQIRKLTLDYIPSYLDFFNNNTVTEWVEAALGPHLNELGLRVWSSKPGWTFVVPPRVFSCHSLVSLKLVGVTLHLTPQAWSSIHLPSLKTLQLLLDSPNFVDTILYGCPRLETLHLTIQRLQHYYYCAPTMSILRIHVPSLKQLAFIDSGNSGIIHFELDTPSLEYLFTRICFPYYRRLSSSFNKMPNVVEARLGCLINNYHYDDADVYLALAPNLLRSLSQTRSLVLEWPTVKSLLRARELRLPEFTNLSNLEIHLNLSSNTSLLLNMLDKCHNLRVLTIYKKVFASGGSSWTQPASVPKCLETHLLVVKFSKYRGNSGDQQLIAYILQHGQVLTSVTIETTSRVDSDKHRHITQQFRQMPKGSNTCHLNVKGNPKNVHTHTSTHC